MRSNIKEAVKLSLFYRKSNKPKKFFKPFCRLLVNKKSDLFIWSRNNVISEDFVGKRVAVYNGRKFLSFLVRGSMIGRRFGEFSFTKKIGAIHTIFKRPAKLSSRNKKKAAQVKKRPTVKVRGKTFKKKGFKKFKKTISGKRKLSRLQLR